VILRCLQKAPRERFDSVREVATLLEAPVGTWVPRRAA
jgi:hypothetical protein